MLAAVFGLLGVIVGGLITAGVEFLKAEREARAEARAACRLLELDLGELLALSIGGSTGNPPDEGARARFLRTPPTWVEYRPTFAKVLTEEEWRAIAVAVVQAEIVKEQYERASEVSDDQHVTAWRTLYEHIQVAHDLIEHRL